MSENVSQLPELPAISMSATTNRPQLDTLTRLCVDDLLAAFGLGWAKHGATRWPLELAFQIPVRRLARQVLTYDEVVGEAGLDAGGEWALKRLARRTEVFGQENVPRRAPLLLVSNHPGLADAVTLFAKIPRADLRVIAAQRPFLEALPNTSRYLLTVSEASPGRLGLVREATRHLKGGGAVLTFPGGRIEPDPAVLPGAADALRGWSESVDLFARLVPELTVVPVIVSGVLSKMALRNPLIYVRRERRDREWLAATIQMLVPALRDVTTRVVFGEPVRAGKFPGPFETVSSAVLAETRRLLEAHGAR